MALDVEATRVAGEWIRHAPHRSSPPGRGAEPSDGRWQHGAVVRGLYLADDAMTATAEWYRFLAEAAFRPRAPSRTTITSDGSRSSSPISAARNGLAAVGLALPRPSRRTWPAFQDVGAALCRAGWSGLLASSAARPGAQIVWPPAGCEPLRAVEIAEVPTPADRHDHLIRDALANSAMPSVCDSARHGYITSPHPRGATGRVARSPAAAAFLATIRPTCSS